MGAWQQSRLLELFPFLLPLQLLIHVGANQCLFVATPRGKPRGPAVSHNLFIDGPRLKTTEMKTTWASAGNRSGPGKSWTTNG